MAWKGGMLATWENSKDIPSEIIQAFEQGIQIGTEDQLTSRMGQAVHTVAVMQTQDATSPKDTKSRTVVPSNTG